jgi:glycosyltransferase involved in cell wall biosynthesis
MTQDEPLRLLLLAPFAPRLDAPHGGGRSIAQLVTELGLRHRVALLALRPEGDPPVDEFVRERCELVEEISLPGPGLTTASRWGRRTRLLGGLVRGRPMWVADCWVPAFAVRVEELVRSWRPDVVQAEFHVMGQYLAGLGAQDTGRLVTQHEPGASAAAETWRASRGLARLLSHVDALAWRRYEASLLNEVEATVVYTERDLHSLAQLAPKARIVRISLGGLLAGPPPDGARVEPEVLLFVGNFMHPPNVDAAKRLVDRIMPRVLRDAPKARLYVVGDRAPAFLRDEERPGIVVTGWVEHVTPYLARAAVVVAPIRTGGGQRVKVIDALIAGKALVASRRAIEGFDLKDGREVTLAETDEEFANEILRLVGDEDERVALGSRARAWAEANLGWARTIDGYDELYSELARGDRRRRPK